VLQRLFTNTTGAASLLPGTCEGTRSSFYRSRAAKAVGAKTRAERVSTIGLETTTIFILNDQTSKAKPPRSTTPLSVGEGLGERPRAKRASHNRASVSKALRLAILLGDQIWLEVNISAPPGTKVSGLAPDHIDALQGLETIDAKALNVVAETPELLLQQRFLITSFDTGYIAVPPLPFVYKAADGRLDTAYTNDLLLTVNALPVGDDEEIMPIKPIIEEPLNLLDFWWLFLLLIAAGLGYLFYTIQKRRKAAAPPPPPPPPAYVVGILL